MRQPGQLAAEVAKDPTKKEDIERKEKAQWWRHLEERSRDKQPSRYLTPRVSRAVCALHASRTRRGSRPSCPYQPQIIAPMATRLLRLVPTCNENCPSSSSSLEKTTRRSIHSTLLTTLADTFQACRDDGKMAFSKKKKEKKYNEPVQAPITLAYRSRKCRSGNVPLRECCWSLPRGVDEHFHSSTDLSSLCKPSML